MRHIPKIHAVRPWSHGWTFCSRFDEFLDASVIIEYDDPAMLTKLDRVTCLSCRRSGEFKYLTKMLNDPGI